MGKTQLLKTGKNDGENHEKFSQNFSQKNLSKNPPKIRWNSRTMEWLNLPLKVQKEFRDNLIAMEVDYLQYTCYHVQEPLKAFYNILGFNGTIDDDNSNVEYNYNLNLSLVRNNTKMGHAYMVTFLSPGFAPIPILSLEVYSEDKEKLLKTQGKLVFYGAYFAFRSILVEEAPEILRFHNLVELSTTTLIKTELNEWKEKPVYKCTRVDIATDVAIPLSKKWLTKYIKPHKNSKHAIRHYNYDEETEIFQSVAYIPKISQTIGIRVYNKILDIVSKNKQSWYPTYGKDKEHKTVTRIEIIYGWESANDKIENLMDYTKYRLLGDEKVKLKKRNRPKSEYSPLSAYKYFQKYAKNHGKTLSQVLDDVLAISIIEERKDIEYQN